MKIAFNFRKGHPALREGFLSQGCEVVENVWRGPGLEGVDACVMDFYEGVRHPLRALRLKAALRRWGAPLIGVDRDAPWHKGVRRRRLWLFDLLGVLDIYATHSLQNVRPFAPTVLYFPNGAWTSRYHLGAVTLEDLRRPDGYRYDVSFLGNLDGARYPEHRPRVEFLAHLEEQLRPQGIRCLFRDSGGMTAEEQVEIIQRSRINLNYGAACDHGQEKSWGLAERCYGVPACGGFLLSDERRHAGQDFDLSTEWAAYRDLEDCVARIRHYLGHFEEARAIAEAAHRRVLRDHGYERRAARLLAAVNAWRKARTG